MKKQHTGQHYQRRSIHPCDEALFSFSFLLFAELISIGQITYKPRLSKSQRNTKSKGAPPLSLAGKYHDKKDLGMFLVIFPPTNVVSQLKFVPQVFTSLKPLPGSVMSSPSCLCSHSLSPLPKGEQRTITLFGRIRVLGGVFVMVAECGT